MPAFGTKIAYKGYILKSRVEFAWAQEFEARGLAWEYEPVRFRDPLAPPGKGYTYTPDFGLDGGAVLIECKVYGARNLDNRFHFCSHPLILIFGIPTCHYVRYMAGGSPSFSPRRFRNWEEAYRLVRKAAA